MANKIISLITTNFVWKVTALVLASILWIIAVNIEDPLENRRFTSVRVGFENVEALERLGLVLLNQDEIERSAVQVTLWANRRLLSQLESSDMLAYVDLSAAVWGHADWEGGVPISAPYSLRLPPAASANIMNDSVFPPTARLLIDTLDSREFPVSVVKIGDPLPGYISMEPRINPHTITITGASTILDSIVHVRTQVYLTDASEDYTTTLQVRVYNENNVDITNRITLDPSEIQVFIPIYRRGQVPVVMPEFVGALPANHVITNVLIEPAHIDVVGMLEDIEAFRGVVLEPVDISGFTSTSIFWRDARDSLLATPLSVQNSRPHEVSVTVVIEREEEREFIIPIENIEMIGELPEYYEIELPEHLYLRLIGVTRVIDMVDIDEISLFISIGNLEEGVHDVPVTLILPSGVRRADPELNLEVIVIGYGDVEYYEEYNDDDGDDN